VEATLSGAPQSTAPTVWIIHETDDGHWQPQREGAPRLGFASSEKAGAFTAIIRWCRDMERGLVRIDVKDRDGQPIGNGVHIDFGNRSRV